MTVLIGLPSPLSLVNRREGAAASGHSPPGFTHHSRVFPATYQMVRREETTEEFSSFRSGEWMAIHSIYPSIHSSFHLYSTIQTFTLVLNLKKILRFLAPFVASRWQCCSVPA